MDAARAAVSKITGKHGHTTDVDERVNPAVVSETVKPHRHEETTEAIDREVHQDHHHTTVQPIAHQEVLPEKHSHNLGAQVNREFRHDNKDETQRRVQAELGQFQNTSTVHNTTQSHSAAGAVTGEHVHHHVHETVQPVIHKETVQPEVVHTTVPIHETHHAQTQHHGMSALPMKTLDEFKQGGGVLSGNTGHTHEEYEGAPRPYNDKFSTTIDKVLPGQHGSSHTGPGHQGSSHTTTNTTTNTSTGISSGGVGSGVHDRGVNDRSYNDGRDSGVSGVGHSGVGHSGVGHSGQGYSDGRDSGVSGVGHSGQGQSGQGYSDAGHQGQQKPGLMQKLNPKVDSDGDGKAGFMK